MIGGALFAAIPIYLLFAPPADVSVIQFIILVSMVYMAWTMIEIPYNSWGSELSEDYNERTVIVTFRTVAATLGSMIFLAAPLLPISESSEFDPPLMKTLGLVVAVALPLFVLLAVRLVPKGEKVIDDESTQRVNFSDLWKSILKNGPFLRFVVAFAFVTIGSGVYNGLLYIFIDVFLDIGEYYSYVAIAVFVLSWVSLPAWTWILSRLGKHQGWISSVIAASVVIPMLAFIEPGEDGLVPLLMIAACIALASGASLIAPYSIMADVIDFDEFRSGVSQASNYFSVMSLLTKACAAVGAGLGLIFVGIAGYEVGGNNSAFANTWFLIVMLGCPVAFNLILVGLLWNFPLDKKRLETISKYLKRRKRSRLGISET